MELEKLAEHYAHNYFDMHETNNYKALKEGFLAGYKTAQKELYTKEDIYNCLGAFAYKYGITINGNDLTKWLKDRKL